MTCGERKPGSKPAIPPGILAHIERRDAELRERGITPKFLELLFAEQDRLLRADAFLADIAGLAVLHVHHDDGWRVRRRLKRDVQKTEGLIAHIESCADCGFWIVEILACWNMLEKRLKTAPTE